MNAMVFKHSAPDPVGMVLGTRFNRFVSRTGIDGLAKENGYGRLDILAVHARTPGNCQFTKFIKACKQNYKTICIWHVDNPFLPSVLERYGFEPALEVSGLADGEILIGYRWDFISALERP